MLTFLAITFFIMLAAISPGPDFVIVVKNSLLYSRKTGIMTAFGVAFSLSIHALYCILGLAIIITQSLLLFTIIKYTGAVYLIYLGIKSLFTKNDALQFQAEVVTKAISLKQAFLQGLLCNLLNPKAIIFLLAFFTVIIEPSMPLWQQAAYGIEITIIHLVWFSILAIMITHHQIRKALSRVQTYIVKLMGVALIGFGARIAMLQQE